MWWLSKGGMSRDGHLNGENDDSISIAMGFSVLTFQINASPKKMTGIITINKEIRRVNGQSTVLCRANLTSTCSLKNANKRRLCNILKKGDGLEHIEKP